MINYYALKNCSCVGDTYVHITDKYINCAIIIMSCFVSVMVLLLASQHCINNLVLIVLKASNNFQVIEISHRNDYKCISLFFSMHSQ